MSEKTKRKKRKNFWCFLVLVAAIFITDFQGKKLGYFLTGYPHFLKTEQIMKKFSNAKSGSLLMDFSF